MNVTDSNPAAERLQPIGERMLRPMNDRVLVKRLADDEASAARTTSGLIMPDVCRKLSKRGVVVACGPGKRHADGHRIPLDVIPGDVIEFGRYTDFDDGELLLIQEADIVGIIEEE